MKTDRQEHSKQDAPSLTLVAGSADAGADTVRGADRIPPPPPRVLPDDRMLVTEALTNTLDMAAAALRDGDAVVMVEGEPGAGKTAFLRRLVLQLESGAAICHIETRLALGERHVLARIAEVFGCPPVGGAAELAGLLARLYADRGMLLVSIDNADRLSPFALRALFDLKRKVARGGGRLGVVVSARPERLEATLALPAFSTFGTDFVHRITLPRLAEEDTDAWLKALVEAAGLPPDDGFDGAQVRRIHRAAQGLPREVRRAAEDVLNGRKPRAWRSARAVTRARRRNRLLFAAGAGMLLFGVAAWSVVAVLTGPPRVEVAFDPPVTFADLSPAPATVAPIPPPPPAAETPAAAVAPVPPPRAAERSPSPPAQSPPPVAAAPAAPVPSPSRSAPAAAPVVSPVAAAPAAGNLEGRAWLMAQPPDRYTVQVASTPDRALADQFIDKHPMNGKTTVIATRRGDRTLYLVVHGSFAGPAEARTAIAALPSQVRRNDPFARTTGSLQAIAVGR